MVTYLPRDARGKVGFREGEPSEKRKARARYLSQPQPYQAVYLYLLTGRRHLPHLPRFLPSANVNAEPDSSEYNTCRNPRHSFSPPASLPLLSRHLPALDPVADRGNNVLGNHQPSCAFLGLDPPSVPSPYLSVLSHLTQASSPSLVNINILDRTRTNSRHQLHSTPFHLHLSTAQLRLHFIHIHCCILDWSRSRNIFASLTLSVSLHTYSILQTGPGLGRGLLGSRFVLLLGWGLIRTTNYTNHSAPWSLSHVLLTN